MAQFKALAPNVEVNGQTVLSVVAGMEGSKAIALKFLSKHGITDPKPEQWYSQQSWLDAFQEIAERVGLNTLIQIGRKIPENAIFPSEIDCIEKALASIDVAYHMNHRGGEIGHYHYVSPGQRSAKLVCENPYPCDFDRGIIMAMSKRFAPPGSFVQVRHDDTQPCRKQGAESCTYLVTW